MINGETVKIYDKFTTDIQKKQSFSRLSVFYIVTNDTGDSYTATLIDDIENHYFNRNDIVLKVDDWGTSKQFYKCDRSGYSARIELRGYRHRTNGPALIHTYDERYEYWLNGNEIDEYEFMFYYRLAQTV